MDKTKFCTMIKNLMMGMIEELLDNYGGVGTAKEDNSEWQFDIGELDILVKVTMDNKPYSGDCVFLTLELKSEKEVIKKNRHDIDFSYCHLQTVVDIFNEYINEIPEYTRCN